MSTLRSRLLKSSLLIALPPLIAIAVISTMLSLERIQSGLTDRLSAGANGADRALDAIQDGIRARTIAAARSPTLISVVVAADRLGVLGFAQDAIDLLGADRVIVLDPQGRAIARSHAPTVFGDPVVEGPLLSEFVRSDTGSIRSGVGGVGFRVSAPIRSQDDEVIGILLVEKDVDYALLRELNQQFGLDFTIWDGERLQATTLRSSGEIQAARAALREAPDSQGVVRSEHHYFTRTPFRKIGAASTTTLLVGVDVESAELLARRLSLLYAVAALGMLGLIVVSAELSARRIVRPIRRLMTAAEAATRGNLDVQLDVSGDQEIAELGSRFGVMLQRRREVESELLETQADLEARVVARTVALKQSEEHLRQARQLESLGRLAGGIAHDFNNVLTVILGNCDFVKYELERAGGGEEAIGAIGEIKTSAEHAAALTRQLLAFSRNQVAKPVVLDLGATVHSVETMLRRLIPANVALTIEIAPGLSSISADPTQIGQILVNLLVNAVDAMPNGGPLLVKAYGCPPRPGDWEAGSEPKACVALEVTDSGSGMDQATLERIFEPFFTTKPRGKGTGMGLSTVHGIVSQANARMHVDSTPGGGTTFRILFPAFTEAPESTASEPTASAATPTLAGGRETLLLCEDEANVRKLTEDFLRSGGYEVLVASSGEEACVIAENRTDIDLLVTDVVLLGMNGVELAQSLRRRLPHLQVLYISGYTADVIDARADIGTHDLLLEKPFTRTELLSRVRALLDARRRSAQSGGE